MVCAAPAAGTARTFSTQPAPPHPGLLSSVRIGPPLRSLPTQAQAALRSLLRQLPTHSPEIVPTVQSAVVGRAGQRPRATSIAFAAAERRLPTPSGPAAAVPLSKTATVERENNPGMARPTASARRPPADAAAYSTLNSVTSHRTRNTTCTPHALWRPRRWRVSGCSSSCDSRGAWVPEGRSSTSRFCRRASTAHMPRPTAHTFRPSFAVLARCRRSFARCS